MIDLKQYGLHPLEEHAAGLNMLCVPDDNAVVKYDLLAGALLWSDETDKATPFDVTSALRFLWHIRTLIMLDRASTDHEFWKTCQALFPCWVGFLPERRTPTPELLAAYRRGEVSMRWCLRQAEREGHIERA
jgi:hypothetical protein